MTVRTRMATMVILLLLGCVFAAPYYRHSRSDSKESGQIEPQTLALQWREASVDPRSGPARRRPLAVSQTRQPGRRASAERTAKPIRAVAPFPALQLPPPLEIGRSEDPAASPRRRRLPVKPVRLVTDHIGIDSGSPLSNQGTNLRSQEKKVAQAALHSDLSAKPAVPTPTSASSHKRWHRIMNGDTLEKLSVKYYGTPAHALFLFENNRASLVSPKILPIGRELQIPPTAPRTATVAQVTPPSQTSPSAPPPSTRPPSTVSRNIGWRGVTPTPP